MRKEIATGTPTQPDDTRIRSGLRNTLIGFFEPIYATFTMERVDKRDRSLLSGRYNATWSLGFSGGSASGVETFACFTTQMRRLLGPTHTVRE